MHQHPATTTGTDHPQIARFDGSATVLLLRRRALALLLVLVTQAPDTSVEQLGHHHAERHPGRDSLGIHEQVESSEEQQGNRQDDGESSERPR